MYISGAAAAAAKSLQWCPTLCNTIDGSPPGFPVPGILQARTLEWVAISFSNAWKWKVKSEIEVAQSCPTLSDPMDCSLPGSSVHEIFQARVLEWGAIAFSESRLRKCNNLSQKTIHLDGILQLCNINTKVCSPVKNHYHLWDLSWCNSHCMVNLKENTCDILTETQLAADGWLRRNWKKC